MYVCTFTFSVLAGFNSQARFSGVDGCCWIAGGSSQLLVLLRLGGKPALPAGIEWNRSRRYLHVAGCAGVGAELNQPIVACVFLWSGGGGIKG